MITLIFSSILGLPSKGRYRIRHEIVFAGDKFVRHGAVGARLIHASAHARFTSVGCFQTPPLCFDLSLSRSVAISIAEGSRALHIPY